MERRRKSFATPKSSRLILARPATVPFLELDKVVAAYGKVEALRGLTLRVEEGEIIALLGANGADKSTTLRVISGLAQPHSGALRFAGRSTSMESPDAVVLLS